MISKLNPPLTSKINSAILRSLDSAPQGITRLGLIGAGGISAAHLGAAKSSSGRVQFAAVVDPSESARKHVADSTQAVAYASAADFFRAQASDRTVDALLICTPPSARLPIVQSALESGLAIFVEKPLAHNLADATKLAELSAKHPEVPAVVGYCHRFVPAVLEMKKRIADGSLGTILRFENTFAGWNPKIRDKWMSDPALSGGGSFIDTGCHSLDLLYFLLGSATPQAAIFNHAWEGRGESSATVLMQPQAHGSAVGLIQSGWTEPGRFTLTLVGSKALLHYDYDKPSELLFRPSEGAEAKLTIGSHEARFDKQLLAFADYVATGKNAANLATFSDGLVVAAMVDATMTKAQQLQNQ